jgi:hypothetical protein
MEYIIEVTTTAGKICERFRSYPRAKRRVDQLPAETMVGMPMIFAVLPDGSQRLVREDGKPLQWHRLADDGSVVTDEAIPLAESDESLDWRSKIGRFERKQTQPSSSMTSSFCLYSVAPESAPTPCCCRPAWGLTSVSRTALQTVRPCLAREQQAAGHRQGVARC